MSTARKIKRNAYKKGKTNKKPTGKLYKLNTALESEFRSNPNAKRLFQLHPTKGYRSAGRSK